LWIALSQEAICWDARCAVDLPNGRFNAGELIYVVEVLLAMILAHLQCHIFVGALVDFDGVHGVEAVLTRWMIQDEGVRVEVGDEGDQGDAPKVHARASPSSEDRVCQDRDFGGVRVVEIYFVLVVDGRVACFSKFACAEERVADK
jgi:hypothetical protein